MEGDKEAFKAKLSKFLKVENIGDVDVREDAPGSWYYTRARMVSLVTATAGAAIYYTTDGTIPTAANGTRYTVPFAVSTGTTLKAIAVKAGMRDSAVLTQPAAPPLPQVATPVATKGAAVANGARWHWWTLKCATPGAAIYYTDDGTTPTAANGTRYGDTHDKQGITVLDIDTLKAIAVKAGMRDSAVLTQPPVAPLR
jgi:LysM repeat protein